jgi:hypothetical protein
LAGTTIRPYAVGQFAIASRSTAGNTSSTGINLGGGAQYWFSDKFGVYGQVNVLEVPISPSGQDISFGVLTPSIGLELFFYVLTCGICGPCTVRAGPVVV